MAFQQNARSVRWFTRAVQFVTWLQRRVNGLTPAPFRLLQIGSAFWQARALAVATRLDFATWLGDHPCSAAELAARASTDPDATHRLLRLLAAMGIFDEIAPDTFANNALSDYLRTDRPQNIRAMILLHNSPEMSRPWYEQLEPAVREGGIPFVRTHGQELFPYLDDNPEFDALFSRAMDSVASLTGDSFVTDFDWTHVERVIDIGGSRGSKSLALLKRYPHLTAWVLDRPAVIQGARDDLARTEAPSVHARLTFMPGDLFSSIPAARGAGDIYLLSAILHGFDDDRSIQILCRLRTAIADTGARIALMELVLPDKHVDLASASFDLQMFMGTQGRERTQREWQHLFDQSGLRLEEQVDLRGFGKIQVLRPIEA